MYANHMAMGNSPITPPPARFSSPRLPSVSFDVWEAVKRQDDTSVPSCTGEQLAFYKDAVVQLREKMGSSDKEFVALSHHFSSQMKMQAAQLTKNRLKNRYVNVLPFDDTRVKLDSSNGSDILGDYINASFIVDPTHDSVPMFIATQGPLHSTVLDFWQMVVQQKCPVVVMLTRLVDDSQERCAHYYPITLNESQLFGQLRVTNKSTKYLRDHRALRRVLEVQNIKDSDAASHTLLHLEFCDWPDFGVPSSSAPVREMVRSLQCVPANAGPFVVHCSAGIGRTGTFCTIYHSLGRILSGDVTALDIGQTVVRFRSQRSGMVQTKLALCWYARDGDGKGYRGHFVAIKDQFRFVYEAVVDELEEIINSHQQ